MSADHSHIDDHLAQWAFQPGEPSVRVLKGADGREVLQMRVDMGILQLEVANRPDGVAPHGFPTYYDYLVATAFSEGEQFALDEERCREIDREFYQYYHRRICWLALKQYASAIRDAGHTLKLMDFSSANAPDPRWALMHEQYRPFVLFHRIQAAALLALEDSDPRAAIKVIDQGLADLEEVFRQHEAEDHFEEDAFVGKLQEMREAVVDHFDVGPSLAEQLAEAIASERYELAAELRDRIGRQGDQT